MLKKIIANKLKYKFTKTPGVAGVCPDCGSIVCFNSYHNRYECSSKDCCFEADINGERVWDNKMREENLKKIKQNQLSI